MNIGGTHMRGIFAVDPGGATGVAMGVFNTAARTVDQAFEQMVNPQSLTLEGGELQQSLEIVRQYQLFKRQCVNEGLLPPDAVELVMEDFQLRPGRHAGNEGLSPHAIIWCVTGMRHGMAKGFEMGRNKKAHLGSLILQQPSDAKGYATGKRLRDWGVWVKGKEHERSAWQHIALRLNTLLK